MTRRSSVRLLRLLDGLASNPAASRAPTQCVAPASRATANAVLAPILGESAFQTADLPTRCASLRVHWYFASNGARRASQRGRGSCSCSQGYDSVLPHLRLQRRLVLSAFYFMCRLVGSHEMLLMHELLPWEGVDLDTICGHLVDKIGPPAKDWAELNGSDLFQPRCWLRLRLPPN